ncbi:MAG: amino acid adenylation domain-containing protein, partial [Cyanobacteria bacterium P01_E01_bin.34]
ALDFDLHADVFDNSLGKLAIGHFFQIVRGVLRDRLCPISLLPLLPQQDRQHLLRDFNPSKLAPQPTSSITAMLEARANSTPDAISVVFGQQSLTYSQLNAKANQLARHLRKQGVGPETRVGICCQRSPDLLVGLFGILKAGAAYVPLDPTYPDQRLYDIVQGSALEWVLTQESLKHRFMTEPVQLTYLDSGWGVIANEPNDNLNLQQHSDSLAYVIYTSGSSGRPKGVGISHRSLASFSKIAIARYEFCSSDRILQFASVSFDAAVEEIFPCLAGGATLYLRSEDMLVSPTAFVKACQDWQLTVLDLPTAYWQEMVRALANSSITDSSLTLPSALRLVIIGGERASASSYQQWQELCVRQPDALSPRLINTYGPTEATVVATAYTCPDASSQNETADIGKSEERNEESSGIPIGSPLNNARAYILDRHYHPVPVGVPGDLYIAGHGLARGYLNRPDLTAAAFIPNPFSEIFGDRLYRTGDIARYRSDGQIEFIDRRDRQVKWRGFRIELADIEAALTSIPDVQDAAVLLRQEQSQPTYLVAYYTLGSQAPAGSSQLQPNQLRTLLQTKLPQYMLPSHFVRLETMPFTSSGKLDRQALPALCRDRSQLETAYVQPTTALERTIADIWQQVLGVERVGLHDNFFDLGGHSLLLVQVHSRLRQALDQEEQIDGSSELMLVDLFQYPTVRRLAERISQGQNVEELASRADDRARKQKQALSQRRRQQARRQNRA